MAVIINGDTGIDKITDGSVVQADLASGVAGTGPAFSAYTSSATSMLHNTPTKLTFNSEFFDTNSNFDTSDSRFTPTIAGYYQVLGSMLMSVSGGIMETGIFKNGSAFQWGTSTPNDTGGAIAQSIGFVYLNGTTDYIELYGYQSTGTTQSNSTSSTHTYFTGTLVRAA